MAHLPTQFRDASSNVEPSDADKANAPKAHADVRDVLAKDALLKEWGIDTILIGSYARHVSIKRLRDVDVFSKLPTVDRKKSSKEILDHFEKVLTDEYGKGRVTRQDRSIAVEFPKFDMHVDSVPARSNEKVWEVPDGGSGWVRTNPEKLGDLTSDKNKASLLSGEGIYVPMVKLVRQTRTANLAEQPGGLYFEILTYWAFESGRVKGDTRAEYFTTTLEQVSWQLDAAIIAGGLKDPTIDSSTITTRATTAELRTASSVFQGLATKARKALSEEDECKSAKLWREILGQNPGGQVFPLPSYCNADGTTKKSADIIPGEARVPAGNDRFA